MQHELFFCINQWSCVQSKLYTEFDLLYDFISATVFGQGNMVLTFQFFWVGYEFTSGAFRIYFLSI